MFIMKINELYNSAKEYADKLKQEKPNFVSDPQAALCLIVTDKNEIFSGVTGVKISGGKVEDVHAEFNAVMSMKNAGQSKARQMISVLIKDHSIVQPCGDCLDLLFGLDGDNNHCAVVTEAEQAVSAMSIRFGSSPDSDDMFSGFDFDDGAAASSSTLGAPVEYAKGIVVDESNPFAASSGEEAQSEVVTFAEMPKNEEKAAEKAQATAEAAGGESGSQDAADSASAADGDAVTAEESADTGNNVMSKEELLKQAKQRKKMTKANFSFWKR